MKVYIVTNGWYDDKEIVGAYSTREKAEQDLKLYWESKGEIEEWEVDESPEEGGKT